MVVRLELLDSCTTFESKMYNYPMNDVLTFLRTTIGLYLAFSLFSFARKCLARSGYRLKALFYTPSLGCFGRG